VRTILIAENNERDLRWYKAVLSKHNYQVLVATNAAESLEFYKSELAKNNADAAKSKGDSSSPPPLLSSTIDVVLLNHRVSDRDGLQVAKEILSINPRQRIIFVSDSDEYTEELHREYYGKVDIMQKPFAPNALIEVLESNEVYKALEKLGLNIERVKECNLYHFQLLELLAACLTLLESRAGENGQRKPR